MTKVLFFPLGRADLIAFQPLLTAACLSHYYSMICRAARLLKQRRRDDRGSGSRSKSLLCFPVHSGPELRSQPIVQESNMGGDCVLLKAPKDQTGGPVTTYQFRQPEVILQLVPSQRCGVERLIAVSPPASESIYQFGGVQLPLQTYYPEMSNNFGLQFDCLSTPRHGASFYSRCADLLGAH